MNVLERLLRFSIQNRWLVVLITLAAAGFGVHSLRKLPIDAVPDITNNQVQISTMASGLSPFEMEKQVTFPIESALSGIPGLQQTRSMTRNGFSQVTAVFKDEVSVYFARQQVAERLLEARESFPRGVEPKMGPISTGLGEVYMWAVHYEHTDGQGAQIKDGVPGWQSDGTYLTPEGQRLTNQVEKASYLRTVQDWIIRPQLKGLEGVAGIDAIGGYEKQYHVQPDPLKLAAHGVTLHELIEALERNNVSTGAGFIEHRGEAYLVRSDGRLTNIEQVGGIVVQAEDGRPLYVRDLAKISVGKELRTGSASENGEEVVVGTALMLIGANSRTVAAAVDHKMTEVNRSLPPDVRAKPVLNRTKLVDSTIHTVTKNLAEGALLVIVILFLFLGNIRAALVTALAIPFSMLLTATGMVQAGISGNLMSLGAIDFGLIVDGAVIIIENCMRVLGEKQHELQRPLTTSERLKTVFYASSQVRSATAFGEAIIITVYLPILALQGIEGKTFHPMALTVIFALGAAFVLSLTFIPALAAIAFTGKISEKENVLIRLAKRVYEPTLTLALRHRYALIAASFLFFVGSLFVYTRLGQEFTPVLDEGDVLVQVARIPSTSLTQATEMQRKVERTLSAIPEVEFVFSKTGTAEMASDPMPPSVTDTFVILKSRSQWPNPAEPKSEVVKRMEKTLQLAGDKYEYMQPIQMRFNELIAGVRSDVGVKIYGDDFDKMRVTAAEIATVLEKIPGAADVKVEQTSGLPVMSITVDRDATSRLGLNVGDVQDAISIALGGKEAGVIYEGDRRFDLIVRLSDEIRSDPEALRNLPIPLPITESKSESKLRLASLDRVHNERRAFVPLSELAKIEIAEGPNQISRENGKRRVVVQCNIRGRDLGSFVEEAQAQIAAQVPLQAGYWLEWGGQFENLISARQRLMFVVPICLLLIFLMLFSTFNSLKYAALVFTGVPLALTGGIIALWVRGMPFSITAAVGFIALFGVAVLNGLVMVTFINELRTKGTDLRNAIIHGSLTRLRPVLMTALVASLGFVPMALANGQGAEVQRPLATVVIGGLMSSTILTLVVLPVLYWLFHREDELPPSLKAADDLN
jgi:heavy metal efflux system protein